MLAEDLLGDDPVRAQGAPARVGAGLSPPAPMAAGPSRGQASAPVGSPGAMKTFDQLFAELSDRQRLRPAGSATVERVDAGVHSIGKKIVEEAAEVWMAAESEGAERTAEEISRPALPHPGDHARRAASGSLDVYRTSLTPIPDRSTRYQIARQDSVMLRIAVPNKGSLSDPASQMLSEAGYRQRTDNRELVLARRRQRHRVLLPAPARHRDLRRVGPVGRRNHRRRSSDRLRRRRPNRSCR